MSSKSLDSSFLLSVQSFVHRHKLLPDGAPVLVALSGGADSVALLLCMQALGCRVRACHCNFHLRGAASDADEAFVRGLCERRSIPLEVAHFSTQTIAEETGESIEMAARRLRYDWFDELLKEHQIEYVAVAHHREDNIETFFLNLTRGAGLHGLTGMKPKNGNVIRPFLGVTREEIERFLAGIGEPYVTDQSNYDTQYRRNKLRQEILPLLREMNPSFDETLTKTMQLLGEADALLAEALPTCLNVWREPHPNFSAWHVQRLLQHSAPRTLLHSLLSPCGFTSAQEADIFDALSNPDGQKFLGKDFAVCLHRDYLQLGRICRLTENYVLTEGTNVLPDGRELEMDMLDIFTISRDKRVATLDADKIKGNLYVRSLRNGDRFRPFGMRGSKLVSDYLTNCHYSWLERQSALLLCDDAGPLWLVGERIDARASVTEETKHLLRIALRQKS